MVELVPSAGNPEWKWFETGPPDYLLYVLEELEKREKRTKIAAEGVRQGLKIFPKFADLPKVEQDPTDASKFVYEAQEWDRVCSNCSAADHMVKRKDLDPHTPTSKRKETRLPETPMLEPPTKRERTTFSGRCISGSKSRKLGDTAATMFTLPIVGSSSSTAVVAKKARLERQVPLL